MILLIQNFIQQREKGTNNEFFTLKGVLKASTLYNVIHYMSHIQ